jgi:hypothetical protein
VVWTLKRRYYDDEVNSISRSQRETEGEPFQKPHPARQPPYLSVDPCLSHQIIPRRQMFTNAEQSATTRTAIGKRLISLSALQALSREKARWPAFGKILLGKVCYVQIIAVGFKPLRFSVASSGFLGRRGQAPDWGAHISAMMPL